MKIWKNVVGYEKYYIVSSDGEVESLDRVCKNAWGGERKISGRRLVSTKTPSGYMVVGLKGDTKWRQFFVHKVVAMTFLGEKPTGYEICHADGDKTNNSLTNIRYGTRVENAADKVLHGVAPIGYNNPKAKLDNSDVGKIVMLVNDGVPQIEVASMFSVSEITISHIMCGRTWSHLTGIGYLKKRTLVTSELIGNILKLKSDGMTLGKIAETLGISKPTAFRHSKSGGL